MPIKIELQNLVFDQSAVPRDHPPKVLLERLKIQDLTESKKKEEFAFVKAFEQLKDIPPSALRPPRPQGTDPFISFEVVFKGELVVGLAGPWRQFFADISKELIGQNIIFDPENEEKITQEKKKSLNLLIPSVNQQRNIKDYDVDKFVINPSMNTSYHLQLFEFLGILMGCCIRTGTHFSLNLANFVWKPLVGMILKRYDLNYVDNPLYEMLRLIQSGTAELFQEKVADMATTLSDGTVIDLIPQGRYEPLQFDQKDDYVEKVTQIRLNESAVQSECMRNGLTKLVPKGVLNLLSWKELEEQVCSVPTVDLEMLKRHTKYSNGITQESQLATWLWQALASFSDEDKVKFIKFCWGQERLPPTDEEFEKNNIWFKVKLSNKETHGDHSLPEADTCFFHFELPNYTSQEILAKQLLFAIQWDNEGMNRDSPPNEQQEGAQIQDHNSQDEEEEYEEEEW